jgi:DUF1009 family protein
MERRIGIIAGSGEFPFLLVAEAQKMGYSCVVAGIKEEAETGLRDGVDIFEWVDVGDVLHLVSFFKKNEVKEAVFAGKVDHRKIFKEGKFNQASRRLLALGKDKSPSSVLKIIIDYLANEGIQIMNPTLFIASSLCQESILTKAKPSPGVEEDIEFGFKIAKNIADLDIGQTVVVKDKAVVAVEGMEGTDEAIKRGGRLAGEETVVVKVSRSFQDARVDLPAVGLRTVKSLVAARSRALCIEAQSIPFFQKEEAVSLADAHKISIVVKKP